MVAPPDAGTPRIARPTVPPTDVDLASALLLAKQRPVAKYFAYYEGEAATPYLSRRIRQLLQGLNVQIAENWSEVVIDACLDRIVLESLVVEGDAAATETLRRIWLENDLDLEANEVHRAGLVAGESFLICGLDDSGAIDAYYNDPRDVAVVYEPDRPNVKRFAAKWWVDDRRLLHLQLYYPDRFEFYVAEDAKAQRLRWRPDPERGGPAANPHGVIPVFHFRTRLRKAHSDLLSVIPLQDAANMTLLNMLASSEFISLPIKYVISSAEMDATKLQALPNRIWLIPPGDGGQPSSVGQLPGADLKPFLDQLDRYVSSLVTISRTPRHYLERQGGDPSGEALLTMEAPLVKKARDRIAVVSPEWRRAGSFLAMLAGLPVPPTQITPVWSNPETVQPRTKAEIDEINLRVLAAKRRLGVPLATLLVEAGYDAADAQRWAAAAQSVPIQEADEQ